MITRIMLVGIMNSPKHRLDEAASAGLDMNSTMQVEDRKFVGIFSVAAAYTLADRWFSLTFPMNWDCRRWAQSSPHTCRVPSRGGNFVVPGAKVEHGPVKFSERGPHQPPVVGDALERPAIGTGTAIHQVCSGGCRWFASFHPQLPGSESVFGHQTLAILAEVRHGGGTRATCKSGTSGVPGGIFPGAPASPRRSAGDPGPAAMASYTDWLSSNSIRRSI